jgi:hypothetical protein
VDLGATSFGVHAQVGPVGDISIPIGKSTDETELTVSKFEVSGEGYATLFGQGGGVKCDLIGKCPESTSHSDAFTQPGPEGSAPSVKGKTGIDLPIGASIQINWAAAYDIVKRFGDRWSAPTLGGNP